MGKIKSMYSTLQVEVISSGILHNDLSGSETTAVTDEEDLSSFTIPANTLTKDGDILEFEAIFSYAANGNTKTPRIRFNGDAIASISGAFNNLKTVIKGKIHRTGAATQIYVSIISTSAQTTEAFSQAALTANFTTALVIKATGQNGSASAADIKCEQFSIQYIPK